jgi:hypothetical protein
MNRIIAAAVASCLMTTALAQDPAPAREMPSAESGWSAITKCAAILDDESRHECSDNVLRDAGLLPAAETRSSEKRKRFGLQKPAARAAEQAAASGAPIPPPNEDQLEVTLAAVSASGDGKLVLTTSEGAIWKQVESTAVRPMPREGQAMTIEKMSLGGFMCRPSKWVSFRCFRSR